MEHTPSRLNMDDCAADAEEGDLAEQAAGPLTITAKRLYVVRGRNLKRSVIIPENIAFVTIDIVLPRFVARGLIGRRGC